MVGPVVVVEVPVEVAPPEEPPIEEAGADEGL
jgi:hypothetical protein